MLVFTKFYGRDIALVIRENSRELIFEVELNVVSILLICVANHN